MSARDSAGPAGPGNRGAGGLGNGGIGGGMGGGFGGGGAGRNGGIGSQTGLNTGNRMYGGMAMGRPGGMAQNMSAWGMRNLPGIQQGPLNRAAHPGLLGNVVPTNAPPSTMPSIFNQAWNNQMVDFATYMKQKYGQPAAPPTYQGTYAPPGRNPTGYPQWSNDWKNMNENYGMAGTNTYPGGLTYTGPTGLTNNWSNDDARFGIDRMAGNYANNGRR